MSYPYFGKNNYFILLPYTSAKIAIAYNNYTSEKKTIAYSDHTSAKKITIAYSNHTN